ncbi:M15 family metallopeptidase [Oxalobacteraceae bacterium OTU3CAMAD1]|nr:M15 family metallopeptidase [Oxalobacteraceae bacterium OTU3CAMAD1]
MTSPIHCETIAGHPDFRHLDTIQGIAVDLRYATPDNFVGRDLYSPLDCSFLHKDAAAALERAVAWLAARRPDYKFLVLDALRPQRVQEQLWQALQGTDLLGYIADPTRGSIHSFGMALDVTLVDAQGSELDMGTGFDDLSERSHPAKEALLLARGELSMQHIENRRWLRGAMFQAGFVGINSEWWHFDCGDRLKVRRDYARVL